MSKDRIRTSDHYGGADAVYEAIKVLKAWLTPAEYAGFLKGNAIKYLQRHKAKGKQDDLDKATQYTVWLNEFVKQAGHDTVFSSSSTVVVNSKRTLAAAVQQVLACLEAEDEPDLVGKDHKARRRYLMNELTLLLLAGT